MSDVSLFVRKASGLVRAWSVFDAFIYATFSINLITLGLFIFSYCYYLQGSLVTGVVVGAIFTVFEVIVYASLISAMPRAGGSSSGCGRRSTVRCSPMKCTRHCWPSLALRMLPCGS